MGFKDMDKGQRGRLLIFMGVLLVVAVVAAVVFFSIRERKRDAAQAFGNSYPEVQDAEYEDGPSSRNEAYQRGEGQREDPSIEEYWNSLGKEDEEKNDTERPEAERVETGGSRVSGKVTTAEDLFGPQGSAPAASVTEPRRPSGGNVAGRMESNAEREARLRRESEERVRRMLILQDSIAKASGGTPVESTPSQEPVQEVKKERPTIADAVGEGAKTSEPRRGDGWNSSSKIVSWKKDSEVAGSDRPYKCMVVNETKVRNGQRVTVRLLEDLRTESVFIPKYTHLMASAQVSDRLDLKVAAIEYDNRIYPLSFEAYDAYDGVKGIYCPDLNRTAKEQARQGGLRSVSNILRRNIATGIAADVVETGVTVAQGSGGNVTVTLPEGYMFYIVSTDNKQ